MNTKFEKILITFFNVPFEQCRLKSVVFVVVERWNTYIIMISFTLSIPELGVLELMHVGCAVDLKWFPYEVLLKRNKGNACNPLVCIHECLPPSHLPADSHEDSGVRGWGGGETRRSHGPTHALDDPASLKVSSRDATSGPRRRLSISHCRFHHPRTGSTSCPFILLCIYTVVFVFSLAENLSI